MNKDKEISIEFNQGTDDSIIFRNGILYACTYSYHIAATGDMELSQKETKKLYEKMKEYYEGGDK